MSCHLQRSFIGQELGCGIPLPSEQHLPGPRGQLNGPGLITSTACLETFKIQVQDLCWIDVNGSLQAQNIVMVCGETWNPKGQAIAIENFRKTLTNQSSNPPTHQSLGSMFTARSTAKIPIHNQDICPLISLQIKWMLSPKFAAIIGESSFFQAFKRDTFQKACGNNSIRVDVITGNNHRTTSNLGDQAKREGRSLHLRC